MRPRIIACAIALQSTITQAQGTPTQEPGEEDAPQTETAAPFALSGYFQPRLGFTYRPDAVPRDQLTYGASDSRTGLLVYGEPVTSWRYMLHFVVGANLYENVTSAQAVDSDGDGTPDTVATTSQAIPGLFIEEASVGYFGWKHLAIKAGQMRIPYTIQHQSPNSTLLFPVRSGPNRAFIIGSDAGVVLLANAADEKLRASLGVFGGSKLTPLSRTGASEQGPLFSLRADFAPLGSFPFGPEDMYRGPLRFEVGAGVLYSPAARFDDAGFSQSTVHDVRVSGSARMRVSGLFLQAEILARQRSDSLADRTDSTLGAYLEGHMLVASAPIGIAPIGRLGWTEESRDIDPRTTLFAEAGLALYLRPDSADPDKLRLILQYVGEYRRTEEENAHGALAQLQLRF